MATRLWCAQSRGPHHHVCCGLHGIDLAALHRAPTECRAQCHISWALRMFLPWDTYTPAACWAPVSGDSVFLLSCICACVLGASYPSQYTGVCLLGKDLISGCDCPPRYPCLLTWLLAPAGGSWTAGSPAFGALKESLAPGGHAECQYVSSVSCPLGVGRTASIAPLEGPGSPACRGWEDASSPPQDSTMILTCQFWTPVFQVFQ